MKRLVLTFLVMVVVGCSAQPQTIVSEDLDQAVVGAKPEGYPKTVVKALPDRPGFCVAVAEDWQERRHQGQRVWLNVKTVASVACTKVRWERLLEGHY